MERVNKKTILLTIIMLIGLSLSIYGALNYQNILSRAGSSDYANFEVKQVKDGQESSISCTSEGICETQSLDVKLEIKDLEKLSE